jgi:hypothetical protein
MSYCNPRIRTVYGSNLILYLIIILLFSTYGYKCWVACDVCMLKTPLITGIE